MRYLFLDKKILIKFQKFAKKRPYLPKTQIIHLLLILSMRQNYQINLIFFMEVGLSNLKVSLPEDKNISKFIKNLFGSIIDDNIQQILNFKERRKPHYLLNLEDNNTLICINKWDQAVFYYQQTHSYFFSLFFIDGLYQKNANLFFKHSRRTFVCSVSLENLQIYISIFQENDCFLSKSLIAGLSLINLFKFQSEEVLYKRCLCLIFYIFITQGLNNSIRLKDSHRGAQVIAHSKFFNPTNISETKNDLKYLSMPSNQIFAIKQTQILEKFQYCLDITRSYQMMSLKRKSISLQS